MAEAQDASVRPLEQPQTVDRVQQAVQGFTALHEALQDSGHDGAQKALEGVLGLYIREARHTQAAEAIMRMVKLGRMSPDDVLKVSIDAIWTPEETNRLLKSLEEEGVITPEAATETKEEFGI